MTRGLGFLRFFTSSLFTAGSPHAQFGPRPKELAVAILFAAATAVPAWSRLGAGNGSGKSSWRLLSSSSPALLDQLCGHREVGGRRFVDGGRHCSPHYPLGQPAFAPHRNHDCAVFAGCGPACAFTVG